MIERKVRYHNHYSDYHVIFFGPNQLKFSGIYVTDTSDFPRVIFQAFSFTNHKHISRISCPSCGIIP